MKRIFENPLIGDRVNFVKYTHESGGPETIVEVELKPRGGNDLHYHKAFDEHFECLEGELKVQVGKKILTLLPGQKATVPKGTLHRFFSESDQPTLFRVVIEPGHQGFESALKIVYGLASDGGMNKKGLPRKFWHMGIITSLSDTNLPGFFSLVQPLLNRSARKAQADGRYAKELQHYTE